MYGISSWRKAGCTCFGYQLLSVISKYLFVYSSIVISAALQQTPCEAVVGSN
jgi:hypothetical protein